MEDKDKKQSAVYVSWPTLKNALEQLSQGVPPSRIDRSVFPGMSWGVQNQLFAGMKFLGLITAEGDATPLLDDLVSGDEAHRKAKLKQILERSYAGLFALDLMKTTPAHLSEKMAALYGVTGDTRDKAVRFFLSAAEYSGVAVSPLLATKKPNGSSASTAGAPRKRRANRPKPPEGKDDAKAKSDGETVTGTAKTITLKSGGTLTLSATLDLFSLNAVDRTFVFDLIDKLEGYEKGSVQPPPWAQAKG